MSRTRARITLVVLAVLCANLDYGFCEQTSTLSPDSSDFATESTFHEDTTIDERSIFTTEDTTITTQSPCQAAEGLTVTKHSLTPHSIGLIWNRQSNLTECRLKYDINIKKAKLDPKEIPYFRHSSKTGHVFKNLAECTAYNVSIKSSSGAAYAETIRTLPEELKRLRVYEENDDYKAEWGPPTNEECRTYKVSVNANECVIKKNVTVLGASKDMRCTKLSVSAMDTENNVGNSITRTVPGEIQNLKVTSDNFMISLTWEAPEDDTCVIGYFVSLNDKTDTTKVTNYNFTDLEACTTYNGEVMAISDTDDRGPSEPFSKKTTTPQEATEKVVNLKLEGSLENMKATWEPPRKIGACITKYKITVWDQENIPKDYETKNLSYVIEPIVPCMEYNFQITPIISESVWSVHDIAVEKAVAQPTKPPTIDNIVWTTTGVIVSVKVDDYKVNMCQIRSIDVNCKYNGSEEDLLWWQKYEGNVSFAYTNSDSSRPPVTITLDGLSPYTEYKCEVVVQNVGGSSEPTTFEGLTLEDVPDAPENLTWLEEEEEIGGSLSWTEPSKIPGILGPYRVNITNNGSEHYIPDSCPLPDDNIDGAEWTNSTYFFESPLPNCKYFATVEASTTVGFGNEAKLDFITKPRESEIVRNLSYDFTNVPGDDYNVEAHITWLLPCNTNGNLLRFKCSVTAKDLNGEENPDTKTNDVEVNKDITDEEYKFDIVDIKPNYKYTVTVFAITSDGNGELQGKSETITFLSPDGLPNEPQNFKWVEDEEGIKLSWDAPSNIPGTLGKYKIYIKYEITNHFIPSSCDVPKHEIDGLEVSDTSYYFIDFLANTQYKATIQASTNAGFGKTAELIFNTKPRESEKVRELNSNVENSEEALIKWLLPCNTNGKLLYFFYKIEAVSLENADDILTDQDKINENEDNNENYEFSIKNIRPFNEYKVTVYAITSDESNQKSDQQRQINGQPTSITFLSPHGLPSAPETVSIEDLTATSGTIVWKEPNNKNGEIKEYKITIKPIQALHPIHDDPDCQVDYTEYTGTVTGDVFSYHYDKFLSNFEYNVFVSASTTAGYGSSNSIPFETKESEPEPVRSVNTVVSTDHTEDYQASITVNFIPPCHINGVFKYFQLNLTGTRVGFSDHNENIQQDDYEKKYITAKLKPEYNYEGFVEVHTTSFASKETLIEPFQSSAGVPEKAAIPQEPVAVDPFSVDFNLNPTIFANTMGEIQYYAIILAPEDFEPVNDYGIWNGEWPTMGRWSSDGELKEYQTTPIKWNPFNSKDSKADVYFTIGKESCNGSSEGYCNGPLRPDTGYSLRVRGFTSFGYRDTTKITFWTPSEINYAALIGGIVGGALGLLLIFIIIIVLWRRRKNRKEVDDTAMETLPLVPPPIPINKFVAHYEDYKSNLNKLKAEYSLLERKSVSEQLPTTFALTDDNKKKNRYVNILPYDETRVKLDRDKNDNYTDYINASYIKGYSGNIEYIATQGPLESTVVDFWRMVIQENVSVVVMVAQFVEHDKAKCHQYFPNNHETINIGDGIEIRCANEVPLGGYIKRTLMVQRELMQMTITHLQYIEWPDFGCPNNTESMLDFCNIFRQCVEQYKSKSIIHCSAGVGRTGTLIVLDILFQTIENKADIDIFRTVLNLRKQRVRMVQTEKQYMFIYTCLAEYISNPKKDYSLKETEEPIYENLLGKKSDEKPPNDIP